MRLLSNLIEDKIKLLEQGRAMLEQAAYDKAEKISLYEKALASTIIKLKNNQRLELDGEEIQNPPATLIEKIARGICFQEKMCADIADTTYKSTIVKINTIESELSAYQSLYKSQIEV